MNLNCHVRPRFAILGWGFRYRGGHPARVRAGTRRHRLGQLQRTRCSYDTASAPRSKHLSPSKIQSKVVFPRHGIHPLNDRVAVWPNRDPIGEFGGINLYGFLGNSPLGTMDPWGLVEQRRQKDNSQLIIMEACEVVILVGHGNQDTPHKFLPPSGAGACGYIGCGADGTNVKISPGRLVDGAPTGPDWQGEVGTKSPEWLAAWLAIQEGARSAAEAMLQDPKCKCKGVTITYLYAPAYSFLEDAQKPALPKPIVIR